MLNIVIRNLEDTRRLDEFKQAQNKAKANKKNLWS